MVMRSGEEIVEAPRGDADSFSFRIATWRRDCARASLDAHRARAPAAERIMNSRRFICSPQSRLPAPELPLTGKSAARRWVDVSIGFLGTGNAHVRGVRLKPFTRKALCQTPEQERFGHRTLYLKIGKRRRGTSFARSQPLIHGNIAIDAALASLPGRRLVFLGFRINPGIVTVKGGENQSLVANVENAFVVLTALEKVLVFRFQTRGARWTHAAVIPRHANRA